MIDLDEREHRSRIDGFQHNRPRVLQFYIGYLQHSLQVCRRKVLDHLRGKDPTQRFAFILSQPLENITLSTLQPFILADRDHLLVDVDPLGIDVVIGFDYFRFLLIPGDSEVVGNALQDFREVTLVVEVMEFSV